ncbi:MAG: TRAP transporter small permease [Desulfovermiculus sp.]|nr:TRAP transporter small permease [Desulfovermiculus sp.]
MKILLIIDRINEFVGNYISLIVVPMAFLIVFETFLRYVLNSPTVWGSELATFLFVTYTFLGCGYTYLKNSHANMNAFYDRFSRRIRSIFDIITSTAFFTYCLVLLWQSSKYAFDVLMTWRHTGTDWNPPLAPVLMTLPLGAFLLLLQGIAKLVRDVKLVSIGQEDSHEH